MDTLIMKSIAHFTFALSLAVSPAWASHSDIFLTQESGKLVTGSEEGPQVGVRYHVNDIAGLVPFVDNNPGFSAAGAEDSFFQDATYQPLPGNRPLGFNLRAFRIQNGPAANLFYWNGLGNISFQPVANANDHLQVRSGLGSAIATGAAADVPGFEFTATDSQGAIHSHLTFDFDVDNDIGTPASIGIFLSAFEFSMDLTGDGVRKAARPHYVAWFNGPPGTLKTTAMTAVEVFLTDEFAKLRLFGDVSPLGEDDLPDDLVGTADLDGLLAALNGGSSDLLFDMNDDATVDADDTDILLDMLGTQLGDANLDGIVDGADLTIWQENYGTSGGWAAGDFNGDATVDGRDLLVWQRHFGFKGNLPAAAHAIPEPSGVVLWHLFIVGGLTVTGTSRKLCSNSCREWPLQGAVPILRVSRQLGQKVGERAEFNF
jgi:hypothetical protein